MNHLHALLISFNRPLPNPDALYETTLKFDAAIKAANTGIYDGHVSLKDNSAGDFFMYGPDADKLFESVKPVIAETDFLKGGSAFLRYGEGKTAKTKTIQL